MTRYLSIPQAAKHMGVSAKTLHSLIDAGKLSAICPNKQRRVALADVLLYIESSRVGPAAVMPTVDEEILAR